MIVCANAIEDRELQDNSCRSGTDNTRDQQQKTWGLVLPVYQVKCILGEGRDILLCTIVRRPLAGIN